MVGVEPTSPKTLDSKSNAPASYATPATQKISYKVKFQSVKIIAIKLRFVHMKNY